MTPLEEIAHLLRKLNRKVQRLIDQSGQGDFSKEDAQVRDMTQRATTETSKLQQPP